MVHKSAAVPQSRHNSLRRIYHGASVKACIYLIWVEFQDVHAAVLGMSIAQLAKYLNVQSRHISQVINQQLDENFHDFVNKYRVDEVKLRITNPEFQHLTIVGMALESGFKSRSAFQTAFKKHTGMTPSAYKSSI